MIAIDTHAHVFSQHDTCIATARYTPSYDADIETFIGHLDAHGLSHAVLVQPSFFGSNNQVLLNAIQQAPERLKGVAVVEHHISTDALKDLKNSGIVGIRINLFGLPRPDLNQADWHTFLQRLEQVGLLIELHAPPAYLLHLLPQLAQYQLQVVIDHFARPDPSKGLEDPNYQALFKLLNPQQHWVKVSAYYRLAACEQQLDVAQKAFAQLKSQGMLHRLLWGSDWPHTQHEQWVSYDKVLAMFKRIVSDPSEQALILGLNAAVLFDFVQ